MGMQYKELSGNLIEFIHAQKMFFVATADVDGKVNVSPKGLDSFHIINKKHVLWLNLTGSGNETATHIQNHPRMTIMFNALEGNPLILRLYGQAKVIHINDTDWKKWYSCFDDFIGARQLFLMSIDLVQTSCGMAVPLYDYKQQRNALIDSAIRKGEDGVKKYWQDKNALSLDGKETNIIKLNL